MKKLLPLFLLLVLLTQCKWLRPDPVQPQQPPPQQLPPETQEGLDTFGCLVNGQVWVPNTGMSAHEPLHADYSPVTGEFFVIGKKIVNSQVHGISVNVQSLFGTGNFPLSTYTTNTGQGIGIFGSCLYQTDSLHTGQLEITHFGLDPYGNRIISGRFHFTVVTSGCDTLRVTNGRFDIRD